MGSFVLIAVGLLVWLLVTSQKTHELFEEEILLYGTTDSPQAINKGTNIIISGLSVGNVSDINIDDNNHMIVTMSILKKYLKLIRIDSTASLLNFQFAQLGKSVIEISIGSPDMPVIQAGSTMKIKEAFNLVKVVSQFEPALITLEHSIYKMDDILHVIDPDKVEKSISNLEAISNDLKTVSSQINQGNGLAGNVVYNKQLQQDVITSTENLKEITEQTLDIIGQTRKLLISIQQQVDEMPEITKKVKPLLDQADKTIKATQQIWPLSNNIPKENRQTLTSPEATE